jgi:hypothetical protein
MKLQVIIAVWLTAASAAAGESAVVGVSLDGEDHGLPRAVLSAMRDEAGRILEPAGVRIRWNGTGAESQYEGQARLVVVRLVGAGSPGVALRGSDGVLGVTHMSDGRILPFIDMDVQRVARAIQRLAGFGRAIHPNDYGRALGRVLGHELYHVLSESVEHDSDGVSKGALGGAELVRNELRLSEGACRRIREALGLAAQR